MHLMLAPVHAEEQQVCPSVLAYTKERQVCCNAYAYAEG